MGHYIDKAIVKPQSGPKAIGPYSVGMISHHFVFTAGQIGLDPATGNLVDGGIQAETRQTMSNLRTILEAAGSSLDLVVKTTVFLRDMNEFGEMNAIYAEFFTKDPPARSTVQVVLPKNAAVEIEAVAVIARVEHND